MLPSAASSNYNFFTKKTIQFTPPFYKFPNHNTSQIIIRFQSNPYKSITIYHIKTFLLLCALRYRLGHDRYFFGFTIQNNISSAYIMTLPSVLTLQGRGQIGADIRTDSSWSRCKRWVTLLRFFFWLWDISKFKTHFRPMRDGTLRYSLSVRRLRCMEQYHPWPAHIATCKWYTTISC